MERKIKEICSVRDIIEWIVFVDDTIEDDNDNNIEGDNYKEE